MKKRLVIIAFIFSVLGALLIIGYIRRGREEALMRTTGIVEATEVNLSSRVPGRIANICCAEGDEVSAGQVAIALESEDLTASLMQAGAALERARAEVAASEAAVDNAEEEVKSARAGAEASRADVSVAESRETEAGRDLERSEGLLKDGFISKSEFDVKKRNYDVAAGELRAAKAQLIAAEARRSSSMAAARRASSAYAASRAALKEAEANRTLRQANLAETVIKSPINGVVAYKAADRGEVVSAGMTILTILDLKDLWVRADIEETLIPYVGPGGEAVIKAGGTAYKGTVFEIGRHAEFATQKDVLRGRQDIKTFRVKLRVRDAALKPGMTVEVEMPKGSQTPFYPKLKR
jgi:HlyD family secretion protein